MITPELIGYIRSEFAKGKTRDEIHQTLVTSGGWAENDLNEAFRTVIPMQNFTAPATTDKTTAFSVMQNKNKVQLSKSLTILIVAVLVLIIGASLWFFRPQVVSFWNSTRDNLSKLSMPSFSMPSFSFSFDFKKILGLNTANESSNPAPVTPNNVAVNQVKTRNCGISAAPNLKDARTYQNNAVLACLGDSALRCEDARAILQDSLFPTIFQIRKNQDTCNFELSYSGESTLVDATGKKLAGQYVTCPLSLVKELDETKTPPSFGVPNTSDLGKYACQIYFYGTLGLFIENNVDQNRIQNLGCRGDYISSVIASYQKAQ